MTFCHIPAGEFRMGSRNGKANEQPVHRVIIPQSFWLAATPVTQQQFARFDPAYRNYFHDKPNHPAVEIDWDSAREFCRWLEPQLEGTDFVGLYPDLATEAQWEYACRAGTETDYYTGDGEQALARAGWDVGNSGDTTHAVRQLGQPAENYKLPNAFGLYDMHGNVDEWCRDGWQKDAYRLRPDGFDGSQALEPTDYLARAIRGGAWNSVFWGCRSAFRLKGLPGLRWHFLGFRVGLFPGPSCPGPEAQ